MPHPLVKKFNDIELILSKTMEYLSIPSVVGHEQLFYNHLANDFKNLNCKIHKHPGLLEIHGSNPKSAIICAHIDRHGLISIGNGEYAYAAQYIREIKYGENNQHSRPELESIADRFQGETVFAYNPETGQTLGSGKIRTCNPCIHDGDSIFFVDKMRNIENNIPLAYARTASIKGDYLRGQIDNTISIGIIYALFQAGFEGTALLTCEEEIGKSWLHIANFLETEKIRTQNLIVIDTSPYSNEAPIDNGTIILRNRDFRESFNPDLTEKFKARCADLDMEYQMKDEYLLSIGKTTEQLGSTELGRLILHSHYKWSGTTVQIPTLAYHTSSETTSKTAIKNYFQFLHNILTENPLDLAFKTTTT